MEVIKRNGEREQVLFDKISNRVKRVGDEQNVKNINYTELVIKVIEQLYDGIPTSQIDELTAQQCASMATSHLDYGKLGGAILVSNHHKNTSGDFSHVINQLWECKDKNGINAPIITNNIFSLVSKFRDIIAHIINYDRDYLFDYFGFKTLERAYLLKVDGKIVERPQDMWMRVSLAIHGEDIMRIEETYNLLSTFAFTHATPTLFNAGTMRPQLSSCYLIAMENDSIDGIFNTLKDCAAISKLAGGIGIHIHNIRAKGSLIRGTNGTSNGIVPMLRVFNNTARYVDQCITPETYLYTTQGPKKIENVINNETCIINEKGDNEIIENVLEHPYEGKIYNIDTTHSLYPLKITGEHPILCLSNQKKGVNYNVITNRLDKQIITTEWKDVKDLTYDDMLVYTIPTYEKDYPKLSSDDCYFYGIILGDGSFSNRDQNGYISVHTTKKTEVLQFCKNYLQNYCVEYRIIVDDNTTRIRWNKNIILPFRYSDVYDENKEKHITHKWLNLPLSKAKYIVKGLIDTDG